MDNARQQLEARRGTALPDGFLRVVQVGAWMARGVGCIESSCTSRLLRQRLHALQPRMEVQAARAATMLSPSLLCMQMRPARNNAAQA